MFKIESYLRDYLNYLEIEKGRSPKTRENYEHYLKKFIALAGVKSPEAISDDVIREFRIKLARDPGKLKKVTQNYHVIAVRNFLKYLVKRNLKVLSPERIELSKISRREIDVLDYTDLERLLAAPTRLVAQAKREGNALRALRDRAILETFFSTGLRLAELCSLERYLDLERGEVSIRGKGDKLRLVFLAPRTRRALKEYLDKRTDTEPALFISLTKNGRPLGRITPRAVQRLVAYWAKAAGISGKIHPHQLRHSFATDLLLNGADLRSVQELLGHANISTTQVYTHLTNRELRNIHEAFHGRRRKK